MMKKMMMAFVGATVLTTALATAVLADAPARILYMEVDQGPNLLDHNDPAFRRIYDHTGNFLHHNDILLFEEDQKSITQSFKQAQRTVLQMGDNQVDAAVLVGVRHLHQRNANHVRDQLVIVAQIISPATGEILDTVRVKSPRATVQSGVCGPDCRHMIMRRHIREILPQFREKLVSRLQRIRPVQQVVLQNPDRLTLTLKGFSPREVRHIEDRIAGLESTRDFSSLTSTSDKQAFWLERRKSDGDVRQDLNDILRQLDLQARIVQTERYVTLIKVNNDLAYLQ